MATVSRSAAVSASQLLGVISTAASTVTTACNVLGNAADVLNVKSQDWLDETRERTNAMRIDRTERIIDEVSFSISNRIVEREVMLDRNPKLKAAYDATVLKVTAALTPQA